MLGAEGDLMADYVKVEGLRELSKALRDVDKTLPKEIQRAAKTAAEAVADKTRASFASRAGVAPKVAPSVKALATQRAAYVRIGGPAYPYALGSNFGSVRFKQFPMFAGHGDDYSLYRTIRAERDAITDTFGDALDAAMRRAFP
jgi:hypothetical protein